MLVNREPEQLRFSVFEDELIDPLRGHELTEQEAFVASLLLDASADRPRTNEELRDLLRGKFFEEYSERSIKSLILSLRDDHCFPIVASKAPPFGYWWCRSAAEMKEQWDRVRGEAVGMMSTWSRLIKQHFPELAGQLRLDFIERSDYEQTSDSARPDGRP